MPTHVCLMPACRRDQHQDWTSHWGTNVSLRVRIHSKNDVAAGALFAAIGIATIATASDYPLGTMRSIGPGYFPILIGGVLALLGAAIGFHGLSFGSAVDAPAVQSLEGADDDDHG